MDAIGLRIPDGGHVPQPIQLEFRKGALGLERESVCYGPKFRSGAADYHQRRCYGRSFHRFRARTAIGIGARTKCYV